MNSNFTPLSRTNTETMGGSYMGADMATNGLSANQNQVIVNDRCMITPKIRLTDHQPVYAGLSITPVKDFVFFSV